jgi:uncharacterized protein YggU (UPF0235/DUF167 family)
MKISVTAKTRSRKPSVTKTGGRRYVVAVAAIPERGKANAAIADSLAAYLGVSPSRVRIVSGAGARQKIFEIN